MLSSGKGFIPPLPRPCSQERGLRARAGFTLLELLIVVVIIGILLVIAITQYTRAVEEFRKTEAVLTLNRLLKMEKAYLAKAGKYTDDIDKLGVDLPLQKKHYFEYSIEEATSDTLLIMATRNTIDLPPKLSPYYITISQDGETTTIGYRWR